MAVATSRMQGTLNNNGAGFLAKKVKKGQMKTINTRSKIESPEEKLRNDGIILQKNVLDKELYDWAMKPWHDIKAKYANVCA